MFVWKYVWVRVTIQCWCAQAQTLFYLLYPAARCGNQPLTICFTVRLSHCRSDALECGVKFPYHKCNYTATEGRMGDERDQHCMKWSALIMYIIVFLLTSSTEIPASFCLSIICCVLCRFLCGEPCLAKRLTSWSKLTTMTRPTTSSKKSHLSTRTFLFRGRTAPWTVQPSMPG